MPLIKEDFSDLLLFELISNIAFYFEYLQYMDREYITNYFQWNIEFAREIWPETFPNFNFFVMKIKNQYSFFMPG